MDFLTKVFTSIILLWFPLYFWGYIFYILWWEIRWIRLKFWWWIFLGIFSVFSIFLLTKFFPNLDITLFLFLSLILLIFLIIIVNISIAFGSKIPKIFLKKISLIHSFLVFLTILFFVFLVYTFVDNSYFLIFLIPIIFSALLEEIAKHFTMLALMGRYFSFSLRDLTIFVFCIVLGFVFVENILYLFKYWFSFSLSISRSIFTFSAHVVSAMIIVISWWKSLSYRLGSFGYIFWFLIWILLSVISHSIYNFALQNNYNIIALFYIFLAYWFFVYWMNKKNSLK